MSKSNILIFTLILSLNSLPLMSSTSTTAPNSLMPTKPGRFRCNDEIPKCTYVVGVLLSANILKSKIQPIMFPNGVISPSVGFFQEDPRNSKELHFWFFDDNLRERVKALIKLMDRNELFTPANLIQLETEIFAVSDEALTNIQADISLSLGTVLPDATPSTNPGLNITVGIGNFLLSAALTAARTKNMVEKVTTVKQLLPNFNSIDIDQTKDIYISPTPGVSPPPLQAGLRMTGSASILEQESGLYVLIKDLDFYYGVEERTGVEGEPVRINKLKFTRKEVVLTEGVSWTMVSVNKFVIARRISAGLPTSVNNQNLASKLLIIQRAKAINFDKFLSELKVLAKLKPNQTFSDDAVSHLPDNRIEFEKVLGSIKPSVRLTLDGKRIITFKLDKKLARKHNIKRPVEMLVRAKGFKQKFQRSTENLMLSGVRLKDLPLKLTKKHLIKIKVKLRPFGKKFGYKTKKVFYFNPETNEFITEQK